MRPRFLLCVLPLLTFGCTPEEKPDAASGGGGEKVPVSTGNLLRTEFESDPTFGKYTATEGDFAYSLEVSEKGPCSLTRSEDSGKKSTVLFSGQWEQTFDGIRCGINRVMGKRKESEAFFKVTSTGYEFKTATLLKGVEFPKAFAKP